MPQPYKSKAERERELWMTKAEAIDHICRVGDGAWSKVEARRQFTKWIADHPDVVRREPEQWWPDMPPDEFLSPPPLFKPFMVLRSAIETTWPLPSAPVASPAAGPAESEAPSAPVEGAIAPPAAGPAGPPAESEATPRPLSDAEFEAAYEQLIAEHGHQSRKADEDWGRQKGRDRDDVRDLRKRFPRKRGRPKRP
jgi:hypothetical protein